ncbi:MAG: hypothetical protein NTW21_15600 [Verrucomicrobia bacterium]|nr:hypothetical protein [Verrucomicrobiota bacterium]
MRKVFFQLYPFFTSEIGRLSVQNGMVEASETSENQGIPDF